MRVCAAELLCLCIHHGNEVIHGTAYSCCEDVRRIVCGINQHTIHQLVQRQILTGLKANAR